jgi:hypothetical protein
MNREVLLRLYRFHDNKKPQSTQNVTQTPQIFIPQSTSLVSPATLTMKILDSVQLIIVTSREKKHWDVTGEEL